MFYIDYLKLFTDDKEYFVSIKFCNIIIKMKYVDTYIFYFGLLCSIKLPLHVVLVYYWKVHLTVCSSICTLFYTKAKVSFMIIHMCIAINIHQLLCHFTILFHSGWLWSDVQLTPCNNMFFKLYLQQNCTIMMFRLILFSMKHTFRGLAAVRMWRICLTYCWNTLMFWFIF